MTASNRWFKGFALTAVTLAVAVAVLSVASAQESKPKSRKERAAEAAAASEVPEPVYSKEFRKLAAPVFALVNEKKWAEVLAALPQLEALPAPTRDDQRAISTWRLQATQGVGDQEAFAAAIEQ